KYKSETGFVNNEALSPFWSGIGQQYNELYASFAANFASYKSIIPKIYLSAGPSGELRYPSYYKSAGWNYPSRGTFQVYTDTAKNAFRTAMTTKYGSLSGVNSAWGLSLTNVSQINPPSDGDAFYSTGGYKSTYGKDFLAWYQSVLENHLSVIATAAHNNFDSVFGVHIGAKISGLHWQYNNPTAPHSAENAAGYYDYNTLIQKFKDNNLDLTFTALEMNDDGSSPSYSMPSSLVDQVSSIANSKGVRLNGENALPTGNFQKVEEKITRWNYNGFTLLRLANLVNGDGSASGNMSGYKQFVISHSKPDTDDGTGDNQVTVYYKKGFSTPFIHYRPAGGTWTTAPGAQIPDSEVSGYSKITIKIGSKTQLEAAFNNGSGTWDSNNSQNYFFNVGTWTYTPGANGAAGTIKQGAPENTDTIAPSVPTNVAANGKTDTSVSLSWTASTDNVSVTGYEIYRDGAKVATSTTNSYTNSGLTADTTYSFTVKAYDAAGNISAASTAVSVKTNPASTTDNTVTVYYKRGYATPFIHYRPAGGTWTTAPGTAMPVAEAAYPGYNKITINIGTASQLEAVFNNGSGTWDNNGSKNYLFNVGTWAFTPGANGAAGTITPLTPVELDTIAPSVPTNVAVSGKTSSSVSLSWTASTDNVNVTGYEIWRDGAKVGTSTTTSYTNTGLAAGTTYSYTVKAYDAANNISAASAAVSATTDTVTTNSVTVYYKRGYATPFIHYRPAGGTWTTAPGTAMPVAEAAYPGYNKITINIGTASQLEAVFNNGSGTWDNNGSKNYLFNVGTWAFTPGANGAAGTITPLTPVELDTIAPSVPTNVAVSGKTGSSVSLSWTASTDNVGVTGYEIWRDGAKVGTSTTTSYTSSGLAAGTTYSYTVKAYDAAGNVSAASAAVSATTDTVTTNSVTVYYKRGYATPFIHYRPTGGTWTTAPGVSMPVSEYPAYNKVTVNIGTATQLEAVFNNGSGTWDNNNSNNYLFNVGSWTFTPSSNGGPGSITAAPTGDGDTIAPSVPTNVNASAKTDTTVTLSWTASTDNVGVAGYEIWRNGAKVGTSTTTSYANIGLTASTTYSYAVKAYDASGNFSDASTAISVTTNPAGTFQATDWSKQSIYFIMTDRFVNGDPSNDNAGGFNSDKNDPGKWHGGDFQGIINNLDYIKNMGFTAIWITPVTAQKSQNAYHGYHTYDFYSIDGHLGSMDKFKELVSTAHNKNIAVMLDVVPNHTGDFQPGGFAKAPFDKFDWYHHNGSGDENGEVAGLDDLNQENPATAAELKNWIQWLINESKVDGLRVDTAKHMPKWFLKDFDTAANTFTIGEVYNGDPNFVGDYSKYLDAVIDFPMYYTIKDVFGADQSMNKIKERYAQDSNYRDARLNGLFIDNHDVTRFLNQATGRPGNGSDKWPQLKAALGFMLTSRGIPILYQGTELGYSGGNDPANREDVVPNANHELYKYIAKVNAVRNSHPALQNGTQKEKWVDNNFYSFQRSKDGDEAIVLINNSWNSETRTISGYENFSNGTSLTNQLGSDTVQINGGSITVTLAPKEVKIFTK
ncbi:family 14 glycosylhydrolase, partial [Paenibacillus sp. SI92]|uniref:family 14 glycosylhydrolase n=1 Tax=Paenibacillus sp. SI92 TaxID=3163027 RepID=UPI0034674E76